MKYLLLLILFVFIQPSFAKGGLIKDCEHLKNVNEAEFVLFNKKEFMQLGECVAVSLIKKQSIFNLSLACHEVIEDNSNPLGIVSLSKLEAIYIGQCLGVINYIFQHYHDEKVPKYDRWSNRNNRYRCVKGLKAVNILKAIHVDKLDRNDIRDMLCVES